MRWPWMLWRRHTDDTTEEARRHQQQLTAQQSEVDTLTAELERRRARNNFRQSVEDTFRGRAQ